MAFASRRRLRGPAAIGVALLIALAYFLFPDAKGHSSRTKPRSTPTERAGTPSETVERPPVGAGESFTGEVVGVLDGDTLEVLHAGRPVRLRLFGIDCPESNQPFGQAAKKFTSQLVFGRVVRVLVRDNRLTYHRVVGEVFVGDQCLNRALVQEGLAWAYRHFSLEYADDEAAAKAVGKGLWSDPQPVPPWEFRGHRAAPPE
jgi:endonuclease YncB( thermonuclease family)